MLPVFFVERISGLRKGELAALLWSNLEVERKALLVSKWVVQGGGIKVTRPKTATYARKISIPQEAVNLLVQEQAAEKLGKSQSAVANKLRLLRLSPDCTRLLREKGLSERHARALLRLADEEDRLQALRTIIARGYNVAQSEAYIERLIKVKQKTPPPRVPTYIIKDVRIFLNTIRRSVDVMQRAGVQADVRREDTEDGILLTIRIPKRAKEAG